MSSSNATSSLDAARDEPRDFVAVASEFSSVTTQRASEICRLAEVENVPPWQYGLEFGDFDLIEVDIIKMMLERASSVQGYQIDRPLGRGGMGVVYQARQLSLNRDVALKTILLSQLSNPTAVKRFENEAKILASLTHPNIVTAYDFGRHDGRLFLAMELVRGKDVQRLIDNLGRIPESLVWHIVRQAAAGLALAAQAGVIHRDIKPANLILVKPPDGFPLPAGVPLVKIADFGLSTLIAEQADDSKDRLTSASMHVGSPMYMAPEQIESMEASAASDIFSLGATAWHMLVGEAPLSGVKLRALITRRLTEPTESVSKRIAGISDATSELVADMLHIDSEKRVPDYELLLRRIDGLLKQLPARYEPIAWMDSALDSEGHSVSPPTDVHPKSNLSETVAFEQPRKPQVSPYRAFRLLFLVVVILVAMLMPLAVWLNSGDDQERLQGAYGSRITLFDGSTLSGWLPQSGSWVPTVDAEGARVLSGTDGKIAYDYSRLLSANSANLFAIEVAIDVGEAEFAEIEFDFGRDTRSEIDRRVIQIRTQNITVGIRGSEDGIRAQQVFSWDGVPPVLLRMERQGDTWWLIKDGKELTRVEQLHSVTLARLRLSAVDGTALFSDMSFLPGKG